MNGMERSEPLINPRKPRELARDCPIRIHLSGVDGGGEGSTYFPWSFRMGRVGEIYPSFVEDCDTFILDSAIHRPEISTDDVIETALEVEPDYVLPADVLHDQEATTERVIEFLDVMDDAGVTPDPIIPIQPDGEPTTSPTGHADHYLELEGLADYYAVGGVMDAPGSIQRDAVEAVRSVAGNDIQLHGLGLGIGYLDDPRVCDAPMLDSLDCSTPIQEARGGKMHVFRNGRLERVELPKPTGDLALLQIALCSGTTLVSLARQLLEGPEPEDHTLADFGKIPATDGGNGGTLHTDTDRDD